MYKQNIITHLGMQIELEYQFQKYTLESVAHSSYFSEFNKDFIVVKDKYQNILGIFDAKKGFISQCIDDGKDHFLVADICNNCLLDYEYDNRKKYSLYIES